MISPFPVAAQQAEGACCPDGECMSSERARKCLKAIRRDEQLKEDAREAERKLNGVRGELNSCRDHQDRQDAELDNCQSDVISLEKKLQTAKVLGSIGAGLLGATLIGLIVSITTGSNNGR